MKRIRIFVRFCKGQFADVHASYSEAVRESHPGGCCSIKEYERDQY